MSATVAPRPSISESACIKALNPCSPAPNETRFPTMDASAKTGQAVVEPRGVMVPRSYPVASSATSLSGSCSLFTPTTARSFAHAICRSPGISAKRKVSSLRFTTSALTISPGEMPKIEAASSTELAANRSMNSISMPRAAASAATRSRPAEDGTIAICLLSPHPRSLCASGR